MKLTTALVGAALAMGTLIPLSAQAATELRFTISPDGAGNADPTSVFYLPETLSFSLDDPNLSLDNQFGVMVTQATSGVGSNTDTYYFYNAANNNGGFSDDAGNYGTDPNGNLPQYYIGPENNPTFVQGNHTFTNYGNGNVDTLSISAVPEASTWVMMLAGFAGLGFVGYRRNRGAAVAA